MKKTIADQQIVSNCIKGDKEAFRQLFNKHSSWMMGVCMRYCRNRDDAHDVLQESLIKIFKAIGNFQFQSESQFRSWLKRIVVNTSLTFLRNASKNEFVFVNNENENSILVIHDDYESENEEGLYSQEQLLQYVQELPLGYRTVFNLYVFENMTHKEIADELNISENTSKTQLFKARAFLKNKILNSVKTVAI